MLPTNNEEQNDKRDYISFYVLASSKIIIVLLHKGLHTRLLLQKFVFLLRHSV